MPPTMFWSIVGQASTHTAFGSGPSTMDRSNRFGALEGLGATQGPQSAEDSQASSVVSPRMTNSSSGRLTVPSRMPT